MKKIYLLGLMILLFIITAGLNKFEKQIEQDKAIYKHNLNITYSFKLDNVESDLAEYKEITEGLNTYFFVKDTYYVNFTKKTNEPFLSSNVKDIIDEISAEKCITSNQAKQTNCENYSELEYPFSKETIEIKSIESLGSNIKGKVEVYILEDSIIDTEKMAKLNKQFIVTGNVKSEEAFTIDNFEFYTIILISLFSYYFLKKSKEKGISRINGASFHKMMIIDIVKITTYLITSMIFAIIILRLFNGIRYSSFRNNILFLTLFHNFIIFIFALGMSLALNKFETISNLIKQNVKNKFFATINFLGVVAISFLFISTLAQTLNEYQVLQIKKERVGRVTELLKKQQIVDLTNDREISKRSNAIISFKKDAYDFTEEKKQDYYFKSTFPLEIFDDENNKLPPIMLVNSSFLEEKFGMEIANKVTSDKIHFFKNQNSVVSDNQISNIANNIIDFFIMNSTLVDVLEEGVILNSKAVEDKLNIKKQERKNKEILAGNAITNIEASKIKDVVFDYDKELGGQIATYQFSEDIVYVYYPYDKNINDLTGIYLKESSQKTNDQINNDFINYFEEESGKKFFFNQDKGQLLNGKATMYSKIEEKIIQETQKIKEEELKLFITFIFMILIIFSFTNYYFKQNIREYSIYKTLGFKELKANKKTITIIITSLIIAALAAIYNFYYFEILNTLMINSLIITLVIELIVILISTYTISHAKKKNNNTAYYVNGGEL